MTSAGSKGNAFDIVRLVLAMLVIFEHSFFLLEDSVHSDPLYIFSGGQINFGQISVFMFLSISGYLVTQSVCRSGTFARFLSRRIARIVPGFLVASLVGLLIVGPIGAPAEMEYFKEQNWRGLLIMLAGMLQTNPAGVFPELPLHLVHGTLWSIRYEFDCYILIGVLGAMGFLKLKCVVPTYLAIACLLALGAAFRHYIPIINFGPLMILMSSPDQWPILFSFFFAGSALWVFRARLPLSVGVGCFSAACLLLSFKAGGAVVVAIFAGSYAVLAAAVHLSGEIRIRGERVDISYGLYLYGWPVQQLWLHALGPDMSAWKLFALTIPPAVSVALVSWYCVERPALRLVRARLDGSRTTDALASRRV